MPRLERLGERSITIEAKRLGTLMGLQSGASGPHAILGPSHSDAATTTLARGDLLACVGSATLDALNIGANGTYLRSDGTDPAWTTLQTADLPALPTPGTLTVATSNNGAAPHTHAITSSSNPGAAASLLATDASGYLQLLGLGIGVTAGANNRITMVDGGSIGQAAGPLLTFDDTNNYLEITGAKVGVGTAAPAWILHVQDDSAADVRIRLDNTRAYSVDNYATLDLGVMTDAQARTSLYVQAGLSNIADAARTSQVYFRVFSGGSVHYALSLLGKSVSVGHTTEYAFLDVRQSTTSGPTIYAYRDLAAASTDSPVLSVVQDNAGDDQYAAYIRQDGGADALFVYAGHANARAAAFSRGVAAATEAVVGIGQTNVGGAEGCLLLAQSDVDEHFIEFAGTAANGDITRSIVDEGDQGGETREGWLKVYVTDAGTQVADGDYFVPFYSLS